MSAHRLAKFPELRVSAAGTVVAVSGSVRALLSVVVLAAVAAVCSTVHANPIKMAQPAPRVRLAVGPGMSASNAPRPAQSQSGKRLLVASGHRVVDSAPSPVPAFWGEIKSFAVKNLPAKESRDKEFRAMVAPSIVSNGFDTVAGVGVLGHF